MLRSQHFIRIATRKIWQKVPQEVHILRSRTLCPRHYETFPNLIRHQRSACQVDLPSLKRSNDPVIRSISHSRAIHVIETRHYLVIESARQLISNRVEKVDTKAFEAIVRLTFLTSGEGVNALAARFDARERLVGAGENGDSKPVPDSGRCKVAVLGRGID